VTTESATSSPIADSTSLQEILSSRFGFESFRANQREVCQAAVDGHDLLLVMPTGSGKSLCYQLPAIVRGGTALVVSPLIALIEDQCAKLNALGFNAARIHSGLDRAISRQACIDYLNGTLDFLFIAPERLKVPGFPEMLAKRKPALIAIDEAHCISQWGHDFRPDYRTLGQHLPALRPAPVIALTATATPAVQRDILTQLGIPQAKKFIHGFRRDNLAIEVLEVPMPMRPDLVAEILADPASRPAIIYAPARKRAEEIAARLNQICPTAAYHAGLPNDVRDSVQQSFQAGTLDCVVATIAFGMGIDKANIRTVIHVALPATLEGYYQEIGRAGRDGFPSRTILMHSYADQRTHDFFLTRDYPPVETLDKIFRALTPESQTLDELRLRLNMDEEAFSKAVEKLYIHGGADVDYANNATRGALPWKTSYTRQSDYRRAQFALVQRFVDGHQCRMAALVEHFGDLEDAAVRCGRCDFCSPGVNSVQNWRTPTRQELACLHAILDALRNTQGLSLWRLQKELPDSLNRKDLDLYLGALTKAGYVTVEDAEWLREGETILYRKAVLTPAGDLVIPGSALDLKLPESQVSRSTPAAPSRQKSKSQSKDSAPVLSELSPKARLLEQSLRDWRAAQAKKLGMPPFLILHDRTLTAIAFAWPKSMQDLMGISGLGPAKVEKFGSAILDLCRDC